MKPNRVPDDLITAGFDAIKAWHTAHPGPNAYLDDRTQMRIVLAAALTLHDQRAEQRGQLRPEYGIRATYTSTLSSEGPVAETLGDALKRLDEFDAMHGHRVVSRELVVRPVGDWRKVDEHA